MPEHGFRAPLPEELAPLFPSYQILSLIATGGMGAVYHAIQTSLEREVAIKILPVESGNDPEFCEAFASEARAMAKLNHPNLIGVYDFGEINGMLFIVMEYVPGRSLHDACAGSAVEPAEVIRLMTGICLGLAHAHEHGILHRDIKPANILLDHQLQPKIGDFGLARPMDAQVQEGETIYGTPGYTAPEVIEPPHTVDQRADIFSLGVLLHELLTGLLPGHDPRPASAISRCDSRFDAVVWKATHTDPRLRYQSAAEIAGALQQIAKSTGPKVIRRTSPAARKRATQTSSKSGAGSMVLFVLAAAAIAVFFFRNQIFRKAEPQPTPVVEHTTQPITPESGQTASAGEAAPDQTASVQQTVKPEAESVASGAEPVESAPATSGPEPVAFDSRTQPAARESVVNRQPKFDVEGFITRARSVMSGRCGPEIIKRDRALKQNLADFRRKARTLIRQNLSDFQQRGGEKQLDEYVEKLKDGGNRMGEKMEPPLKFKSWLVELHEEHKRLEAGIDAEMMNALSQQEKTYLHGLDIKMKALQEQDDPAAVDLIKAEMDNVNASPDYFVDLMVEASKKG